MKRLNKIVLVSLVCMLFVGAFAMLVSAKTYTGTKYGYKSDYIYVHTTKANATIPLSFTKGTLNTCDWAYDFYKEVGTGNTEKKMYASYEVKISYWNGSKYVLESNYDIYNKASHTITLKQKGKDYKIQIYQWRSQTTRESYTRNGKFSFSTSLYGNSEAFWRTLPKFSTGTLKNCSMYSKNPH